MANNTPLNVATEGLLSGRPVLLATDGFIDSRTVGAGVGVPNVLPNNIGSTYQDPNKDWWVRETPDSMILLSDDLDPMHVATEGFLAGRSMPVATDGFINSAAYPEIFGPFTFMEADRYARGLSKIRERSGMAEVFTYLGERGGDPITNPSLLFVEFWYLRGKRSLGGRSAEYQSDKE
jgi:hypothetical protein